jgi:hypothetical protein
LKRGIREWFSCAKRGALATADFVSGSASIAGHQLFYLLLPYLPLLFEYTGLISNHSLESRRSGIEEDAAVLEAASSAYSSPRKQTSFDAFEKLDSIGLFYFSLTRSLRRDTEIRGVSRAFRLSTLPRIWNLLCGWRPFPVDCLAMDLVIPL